MAQSGTANNSVLPESSIIRGAGIDIFDNKLLQKRAKRKIISAKMILSLVDIAKSKGDQERVQQYWNTFHCQSKLKGSGDTLHGDYCKNRFCTVCLANRKAENINKYYPVLKTWKDPHFVTLTIRSIKAHKLKKWMDGMIRAFQLIKDRCKKRHQRGKGIKIMGLKSLECNFNPKTKTYNPHFHIIVPNRETAELLKKEWMHQWTSKHTYTRAQHIVKVRNIEKALVETIKYGSKIFTEPDLALKGVKGTPRIVYAHALDNIFSALPKRGVFDRFGFNLPPKESKKSSTQLVANFQEWIFDPMQCDWINTKSNERLTGYVLPHELEYLLNECIDAEVN